ncbi:hypothetical protein CYMTET_19745, partial [Cymbomonas tetramitiformis]
LDDRLLGLRLASLTEARGVRAQECARMNTLLKALRATLVELKLGLEGALNMSEKLELLMDSLSQSQVPEAWTRRGEPEGGGVLGRPEGGAGVLGTADPEGGAGLFSPQSFLTAVMQTTARTKGLALNSMVVHTEVTKLLPEEALDPPLEGAYIHGFFLEGARWDTRSSRLADSHPKELHPPLPVVHAKALVHSEVNGICLCSSTLRTYHHLTPAL